MCCAHVWRRSVDHGKDFDGGARRVRLEEVRCMVWWNECFEDEWVLMEDWPRNRLKPRCNGHRGRAQWRRAMLAYKDSRNLEALV